jgi:hypothetical protein
MTESTAWTTPQIRRVAFIQIGLIVASFLVMAFVWVGTIRLEKRKLEVSSDLEKLSAELAIKNAQLRSASEGLQASKSALEQTQALIRDLEASKVLRGSTRDAATRTLQSAEAAEQRVNASISGVSTSKLHGFAFYGVAQDNGVVKVTEWRERYFERVSGAKDAMPDKGDLCRATSDVNIRLGYIQFEGSQWRNRSSIGVLHRGDTVRVLDVRAVVPGFIWIEFTTEG